MKKGKKKRKSKGRRQTKTDWQIDRDAIIDEFAEKNNARKNVLCHKFSSMGV